MAKIIVLNAPPGAGKDTIGALIKDESPVPTYLMSLKEPMFEIAEAMLGKDDYARFMACYVNRTQKELPQAFLNGMSPRQFMIWISESVIKPAFGNGYFGKRFAINADKCITAPVICTDGGFIEEVIELVNYGHDVRVCRLHRDGFTFAGDSRGYIRMMRQFDNPRYSEHDYMLRDGYPMMTAGMIIRDHIAK